jgi:hypothetical protein
VDLVTSTVEAVDSTEPSLFLFKLTTGELSLLFAAKVKMEYITWRSIFGQWVGGDRTGYRSLMACPSLVYLNLNRLS